VSGVTRTGKPKGTSVTAVTEPDTEPNLDVIPMLRTQIDAMDAAIIRLVAERTKLSKRIQAARISSGGTRVELGRERVVLDGYRTGLGPDGPQLAEAILRVGRGAR
jgi:chorismate mutase